MKLKLTTIYYFKANEKNERGHPPIIHALIKAYIGNSREWPRLFLFVLWTDKNTHSMIIGYMLVKLMLY